jgi:hypothetical protein
MTPNKEDTKALLWKNWRMTLSIDGREFQLHFGDSAIYYIVLSQERVQKGDLESGHLFDCRGNYQT